MMTVPLPALALRLADVTSKELADVLARPALEEQAGPVAVALVPVGSLEPHGPHLPLATDTLISDEVCERAATRLRALGHLAFVAPSVPYGVTDFAQGFAGAASVPAPALTAFVNAIVSALLAGGFQHVCLVNNHLEPAHDSAIRAAIVGLARGAASVACPLTRRWGRTLSNEFKQGACHAGQYETSLILAGRGRVRDEYRDLPAIGTSLSVGILEGKTTFRAMELLDAYTGAPAAATRAEGEGLYGRLVQMVVTEVTESLARQGHGDIV